MKKTSTLPTITFFTLITAASIGSLFASTVPLPPTPPPSPTLGARNCPDNITAAKVGLLLRTGEKSGVITRKEGLSESEVVAGMMKQSAATTQETPSPKPAQKKSPVGNKSQADMMSELNQRLANRQSGTEEKKELRKSAPAKIETSKDDQPKAEKPEWMKKLQNRSAKTSENTPKDNPGDQSGDSPDNWRSRLRKSSPDNTNG
jgi:hypothetical protein